MDIIFITIAFAFFLLTAAFLPFADSVKDSIRPLHAMPKTQYETQLEYCNRIQPTLEKYAKNIIVLDSKPKFEYSAEERRFYLNLQPEMYISKTLTHFRKGTDQAQNSDYSFMTLDRIIIRNIDTLENKILSFALPSNTTSLEASELNRDNIKSSEVGDSIFISSDSNIGVKYFVQLVPPFFQNDEKLFAATAYQIPQIYLTDLNIPKELMSSKTNILVNDVFYVNIIDIWVYDKKSLKILDKLNKAGQINPINYNGCTFE